MLSSFLRPSRSRRPRDRSPFSSSYAPTTRSPDASRDHPRGARHRRSSSVVQRHQGRNVREDDVTSDDDDLGDEEEELDEDEDEADDEDGEVDGQDDDEDEGEDEDEDGPDDTTPLLPIFSAAHLDSIPVFAVTHALRILVTSRCDSVLTWEQLRSPQVSQFLLKPVESEIRAKHLNAATHYALMANCLQYNKEAAVSAANSGTNKTRAMVCELLAIKLLRDFSTRGLIDALSYDFDPLQGQADTITFADDDRRDPAGSKKTVQRPARISCFEIAIRAQSKRFLAHPQVVKQLEAIWAGTIVFHSAADNLHRKRPAIQPARSYGATETEASAKAVAAPSDQLPRRTVTLYNPRDASLFKLSRLRVPRYRNILSTMSFAVLLSLFVAVLVERSLEITRLEVIFWAWAAGYMLDEIVGFNEQGFSLYLASFWNTFDLGILLILCVHLALRIYGIVMPDVKKHNVANMAYDVLAADAILLFPRLFSVLDHYRYFSPLLIAFRYMAADLVAVSLLILISCSGFFVALTLSFGNDGVDSPSSVAYALLQMVMGFTPAAWDRWDGYNVLGKTILTLFLFICHFLVVTILVTVLTNSFMAIVRNAHDEHQFLFAVNTISHVKSDALFSYVAPTNILQWGLVPLRYVMPFRDYVKINRTTIKITHFPILFSIFVYEKIVLQATVFDSIDLVERRGRARRLTTSKMARLSRAPSIATFRQDRALEEVFRKPYDSTLRTTQQSRGRRKASNVVSTWMKGMGDEVASPPPEQDRLVVDRLESRAAGPRYLRPPSRVRTFSRRTMSIASDPQEFAANPEFLSPNAGRRVADATTTTSPAAVEAAITTDADGDDELRSNDEGDEPDTSLEHRSVGESHGGLEASEGLVHVHEHFSTKRPSKAPSPLPSRPRSPARMLRSDRAPSPDSSPSPSRSPPPPRPRPHSRNVSSATTIFKPVMDSGTDQSSSAGGSRAAPARAHISLPGSGSRTPMSKPMSSGAGHRTPRQGGAALSRMRPLLPTKDDPAFRSAPNLAGLIDVRPRPSPRRKPSLEMDLVSDIGDNRAIGGGYVGALPASFAAQMAQGLGGSRQAKAQKEEQEMFTKIMMARMNSLEEGFRDVIHEMRETLRHDESRARSSDRAGKGAAREKKPRDKPVLQAVSTGDTKVNSDPHGGPPVPSTTTPTAVVFKPGSADTVKDVGWAVPDVQNRGPTTGSA